jgi:hypothetical protein
MATQRTKEEVKTDYTTGFRDLESSSEFLHSGEPLGNGCMINKTRRITYNTGAKFNLCSQAKDVSYVGFPASGCSYTNRSFKCIPGSLSGRLPEVIPDPSRFERWLSSGQRELSYDESELLERQHDAYTRLCALRPPVHMNVVQAACELKDTKQTMRQFLSFMEWARRSLGRVLKRGPIARRVSLLSSCASVASAYLWYQFGVEPTVQDVSRFIKEMSKGKLAVKGHPTTKRVVHHKGQVLKVFYSVKPRISDVSAAMFGNSSSSKCTTDQGVATWEGHDHIVLPNGTTWVTAPHGEQPQTLYRGRTVITRERKGCYFAQVLQDVEMTGLEELQRHLSWNCPLAATMWELTPFSFLVDWVVDVGAAIRRFERGTCAATGRPSLGPIWGWEKEITRRYQPALVRFDAYTSGLEAPESLGYGGSLNLSWVISAMPIETGRSEAFNRFPAPMPKPLWPQVAKEIKAYQISTGMALLAQLASKFRR